MSDGNVFVTKNEVDCTAFHCRLAYLARIATCLVS